jgi:hypothetical protein
MVTCYEKDIFMARPKLNNPARSKTIRLSYDHVLLLDTLKMVLEVSTDREVFERALEKLAAEVLSKKE